MNLNSKDKINYWLFKDKIPVTKSVIVINLVLTIIVPLLNKDILWQYIAFWPKIALTYPWTAITYPLLSLFNPICVLFGYYWMWIAGGSLERSWGSNKFLGYFLTVSAISALSLYVGMFITHYSAPLIGLWMPLACITVTFAMINPEECVSLWCIIPIKLKYLALMDTIIVLVTFGKENFILGVMALISLFYAYSIAVSKRGWELPIRRIPEDDGKIVQVYKRKSLTSNLNPFAYFRKRKEEKKLRDLFRRSGFKD
jgi:membrane associated rhomboid family serine protease